MSFRPAVGQRVRLGPLRARVVGRAVLSPELAPPGRVLRGRAVLVGDDAAFDAVTAEGSVWVVMSAALRPASVPGTELAGLAEDMRAAAARIERARRGVRHGGGMLEIVTGEPALRVASDGAPIDASRLGAGRGIGLAVVRSVAAAHGGQVVLTARPEGGLSVDVALPTH